MKRTCGDCTLCCKLLPVASIGKGAGARCRHQSARGCAVYASRAMPVDCRLWSCAWLVDPATADLRRPDRSRYVVDVMPDYVTVQPNDGGASERIPAVQVWVAADSPEAHRDPALRRLLAARGEQGYVAIIRRNARDGFVLFPPAIAGEWREMESQVEPEHRAGQIFETMQEITAP